MSPRKKPKKEGAEDWTIVMVAAHIKKPYQTARNMMLQGKFGTTKYDEKKRRLTVRADKVRAWRPPDEQTSEAKDFAP